MKYKIVRMKHHKEMNEPVGVPSEIDDKDILYLEFEQPKGNVYVEFYDNELKIRTDYRIIVKPQAGNSVHIAQEWL